MNSGLPMLAIGETIYLHGGSITRKQEMVFNVKRKNGLDWRGANRSKTPQIAFLSAQNRLRDDIGLPLIPLPCNYCGVRPRQGKNTFCSRECRRLNREAQQAKDAPIDMERALTTLHRIAPPLRGDDLPLEQRTNLAEVGNAHAIGGDLRTAQAIIDQRLKNYRILDDCLARAKQRQMFRKAKAS